LSLQFVESVWLNHLNLHLGPQLQFPSWIFFSHNVLHSLVKKTKYVYVFLLLEECHSTITNFDL
jgi:hypothetical protein